MFRSLRKETASLALSLLAAFGLCLQALPLRAQDQPVVTYLVVKYGDEAATQKMAGRFLRDLATFLEQKVSFFDGKIVEGYIANNPDSARAVLAARHPVLAFVPPGFYFANLTGRIAAHAVAQIPRFGTDVERFYLVTTKDGPDSLLQLRNQVVKTTFAFDLEYLRRVVFPAEFSPDKDFRLLPSENLADELFLLLEEQREGFNSGEMGLASALLLDEELKRFFQEDEFVWPELKTIWRSPALPRDLVVSIGEEWNAAELADLRDALFAMKNDNLGRALLEMMNSGGIEAVNVGLLQAAEQKYFHKK
ncbi:MAG: hypothetical protein D6743_02585 [Calditrichaeota bacterium]|nr:MAG: hypothetical protein D6743_02585 [Calditrichota bacterium]